MGFFSRLGDRFSDIGSRSSGSSSRSGFGSSSRSFRFSPMPPPAKYSIRSGIAALKSNSRSNSDTVSIGKQMKSSAPASRSFRFSPMPPPAKYSIRSGIAALKSNSRSNSDTVSIGKQVKNFAPAPLRNYAPPKMTPTKSSAPAKPSLFASSSSGSRSNPFGSRTLTSQSSAPFGLTRTSGTPFDVRQVSSSQGGISQLSGRSANLSSATPKALLAPIGRGAKDAVSISSRASSYGGRRNPAGMPPAAPVDAPAPAPRYLCDYSLKDLERARVFGASPEPKARLSQNPFMKCATGAAIGAGVGAKLFKGPRALVGAGVGCITNQGGALLDTYVDAVGEAISKPEPSPLDECNAHCSERAKNGKEPGEYCKEVK